MAIIRKRQLKEFSVEDLQKRLNELKLELSKERAQIAVGGSSSNPGKVRQIRKTIARIITEINKKGGNVTG